MLLRATLFHTPANAFVDSGALHAFEDGGLLIENGRVSTVGEFAQIRNAHPDVTVRDLRGGYLLPGFVDTHIHFPQLRILGGLGCQLLDWLDAVALPEEARMADAVYAQDTAKRFVQAMAEHGTTTALVFGSHFAAATRCLFEAGESAGLRIMSGLVLSDRLLRPELHTTPERAYRESKDLIERFHNRGRMLYAATPRFALSASEGMLEVCQTLLREHADLRFQTHINENTIEIAEVAALFPWASDYLAVYERYDLSRRGAVMAHNVHTSESQLARLALAGSAIAHCPCSNAALGSGSFAMQQHLDAGVRFGLGTDVGGGTGFGLLKEALQAYALQRLRPDGVHLTAAQLLYLATRAGAEALGLEEETGDFSAGKSADFVYLRPPEGSVLQAVLERADDLPRILAALFTVAGSESVAEVQVGGETVRYDY